MGFRPFVKTLADRWSLCGEVTNIGSGVLIEIEVSGQEQVDAFVAAVRANAPPVEECELPSTTGDTLK